MNICFFEVDSRNLDRYYTNVIGADIVPSLILMLSEKEVKKYQSDGVHKKVQISAISSTKNEEVKKLFLSNTIDVVIISAQRIPDIRVTLIAKKLGIKVYYIQHGTHIPFMKRSVSFFLKNTNKTFEYLRTAFSVGKECKSFMLVFYLMLVHVFGYQRNIYKKYENIFPDQVFFFSEYWKEWHNKYYFCGHHINYSLIGNPDTSRYFLEEREDGNSIVYCYQTLVEDGRISEKEMVDFYSKIIQWCSKNKLRLIVKSHPRMSNHFCNYFIRNKVSFCLEKIPNTPYVIGHYSALLAFWGLKKKYVIVCPLKGHDIPDIISSWAYYVEDVSNLDLSAVTNDFAQCNKIYGDIFDNKPIRKLLINNANH